MKSNRGQKSTTNVKGIKSFQKLMKLRSKKQKGQNHAARKMAGNNLSVKINKSKSLRRLKNPQKKKNIQQKEDQPKESQLKDNKQNQNKSVDTKLNQKSKKNKQTTKQKIQRNKEQEQKKIDTQVEDQINQKLKFYNTKFEVLTEIGIPTINLNYDKIKQFIELYKNEIKLNDEIVISKLIGAIGEGYVESDNDDILNVETKETIIQKQVEQYLENYGIKLEWTQEKWKKLIKSTLIVIPYCQMPNVKMNRNLSGIEKYQIIFETLNLFTQISKWSKMQMLHKFCQNFPLQTNEGINIKELVNENELHNIRLIREYLSRIMNALNKIQQLKVQWESREELHLSANQLQDLSVEYYLNKMKILQLKKVVLPQVTIEQKGKETSQDENIKDPILDESSIKQNDQSQVQNQSQEKKIIQIKILKSKTLSEYFKPTKQQTKNDDNPQSIAESKEKNENNEKQINQVSENKPQMQYFDVLENFFQNKLVKQNNTQDKNK